MSLHGVYRICPVEPRWTSSSTRAKNAKPVKQKLRRLHPSVALQVKEEIDKLHKALFIRVVLYPHWIANIVPVMKKDGRPILSLVVCIDFRNLNNMPYWWFSLTTHGPSGWQHCRSWDALHYGWFLWLQPDQARGRRSGKDVIHNTLGDIRSSSNAFRSQTGATTHKGVDCNLSRYDACPHRQIGGVRRNPRHEKDIRKLGSITKISVEDEPKEVCVWSFVVGLIVRDWNRPSQSQGHIGQ